MKMFKKIGKKKKKKVIILFSLLGLFVILLAASIEYTSHSKFCASCHFMKPFFRSWETSSHRDVECNVCHYPPGGGVRSKLSKKIEGLVMVGRYWTKLYLKSKPWAEIKDESCLKEGCHDKRLLEGKVQFKKVAFDHKIHFDDLKRGKRLQCTSCHSQIVQGEHITVTESSCFICHFKESEHYPRIADCAHCHHKEELVSEKTSRYNHSLVFDSGLECNKCHSNTIFGEGEVPRENCYKCHWEQERLDKFDDTDLMHEEHIYLNKIECNLCHMEIQHKIIKDIEAISDCKTCHTDLHKSQKLLYAGTGGKGITHPMPNVMLEKGLSCKGCHIFHEESGGKVIKSETYVSKAQACESCHGRGFARILKNWETSTSKKISQLKSILSRANREIKRTSHPDKKTAEALLEEVTFNIELVENGKSVHNFAFSQELLLIGYNRIQKALDTVESRYKPEEFIAASDKIPTQCSNCHAGIEEINTQVFGLTFPHQNHLVQQNIECSSCHSNARKHGEFIATKQGCARCHHQDSEKSCDSCHQLQATLQKGGELAGQEVPQDMMSEAEVECIACHLDENDQVIQATKNSCIECHDDDYGEMYSEWQDTVKSLIQSFTNLSKAKKKLSLTKEERAQIRDMEKFVTKIQLDGSSGVHNYMFIEETLTSFKGRLESIKKSPE